MKVDDRKRITLDRSFETLTLIHEMKTGQFINTKGYRASGSFKVNKKVQLKAAKDWAKKNKLTNPVNKNKPKLQKFAAKEKTSPVKQSRKRRRKSPSKEISSVKKKTPVVPKKDSYREAFA